MRATCEHHAHADTLPIVQIVIAEGEDEVSIKVADQGGGDLAADWCCSAVLLLMLVGAVLSGAECC